MAISSASLGSLVLPCSSRWVRSEIFARPANFIWDMSWRIVSVEKAGVITPLSGGLFGEVVLTERAPRPTATGLHTCLATKPRGPLLA